MNGSTTRNLNGDIRQRSWICDFSLDRLTYVYMWCTKLYYTSLYFLQSVRHSDIPNCCTAMMVSARDLRKMVTRSLIADEVAPSSDLSNALTVLDYQRRHTLT